MKVKSKIIGGLILVWLVATVAIGLAQQAVSFQAATVGIETATAIQVEPLSLTPADLQAFTSLSAAQVAALISALDATPTMPAAAVPKNATLWSLAHPTWPPLPGDINGLPVWPMAEGNAYLLNDVGFNYAPQTKPTVARRTMSLAPPGFAGSGTNGSGTNSYSLSSYAVIDYGTNLWIAEVSVTNGCLAGIGSNTLADVQYEIQSRTNLLQSDWLSEGFILGSEITNWTPLSVAQGSRTNLFIRLRSWADDGSGLPLWWQEFYFGTNGIDPYGNPAGDGWSNLQKFQNGWNPNTFYTPPAPQGLTATFNANTSTATLNWLPSPGAVTGYILTMPGGTVTLPATTTSYADHDSSLAADLTPDAVYSGNPTFQLKASYAGGNSASANVSLAPNHPNIRLVQGAQGSNFLAVSALPPGTAAIRLSREDSQAEFFYGDYSFNASNDIPLASFTNGFYYLPPGLLTAPVDAYGNPGYDWWAQTVNANGAANSQAAYLGQNGTTNVNYGVDAINPLYADGRAQMKQNLVFQLRAAMVDYTFGYYAGNPGNGQSEFIYPNDYAYSGFYQMFDQHGHPQATGTFDPFLPFENNYFYRNFVFNLSDVNLGFPTTGIWGDYFPYLYISNSPVAYQFQPPTTSGTTIASLLSANDARWLGAGDYIYGSAGTYSLIDEIGMSVDGNGNYYLSGNNHFGLPFVSVKIAYASGSGTATTTLNAGSSTAQGGYFYSETAQPEFQTSEYDFWNASIWLPSPLPGTTGFSPTNASDLLIVPVQGTVSVAGYAKLSVQNGYAGVYGYLGQYFDQAYKITNGSVTTNTTGVLSPYGSFFATEPGPAALVTMPDLDTGERGTCTVYAVSLQLDANHDGNMDLSFNGPDATSASSPAQIWANNNFDRFVLDSDDNAFYDDDVQVQDSPGTPNQATPDCNYLDGSGHRVIPCARDLQDFFRLWVCGIDTNLIAKLPAGSTVTLNWGDVGSPNSGNPTIDLFTAADPDGGTGYLTNSTIADEQIDSLYCPYIGRLAPGGSIQLNASTFANHWAGSHFIMCGVSNGTGGLNLTIADASGNVLAQSTTYLQIVDIKQMYERWTIGDQPSRAPLTNAVPATENLPVGASAFQYTQPQDTNTSYILYVHGWNMETWEKDRFAEAAFKRLYWQGYHGRFGSFRWPTTFHASTGNTVYDDAVLAAIYDPGEYNAWQSADGLLNKLKNLNSQYPGQVYVLAHSMGNIVTGEALRKAAQQGLGQLVNTYVASQAAVPGHCYDSTLTGNDLLNFGPSGFFGPTTANIYNNWLATNSAAAGVRINFYNTNDFALNSSHWQLDEKVKPDSVIGIAPPYGYNGSGSDNPPLQNGFYSTYPPYIGPFETTLYLGNANSVSNRYEITAFAAEPRSLAMGATPDISPFNRNVDLTRSSPTRIWPSDPNDYIAHFWHSAEFRGDYWQQQSYWSELLSSEAFRLK